MHAKRRAASCLVRLVGRAAAAHGAPPPSRLPPPTLQRHPFPIIPALHRGFAARAPSGRRREDARPPVQPAAATSLPPTLRLVRPDGTHSIVDAATAAAEATASGLDILPVSVAARPPVFRLADAVAAAREGRTRAAAHRAAAAAARRAAAVKELRVGAAATPHDVGVRMARARELLAKGWRVRLVVPAPPRGGKAARDAAATRLDELAAAAAEFAEVERPTREPGARLRASGPFLELTGGVKRR